MSWVAPSSATSPLLGIEVAAIMACSSQRSLRSAQPSCFSSIAGLFRLPATSCKNEQARHSRLNERCWDRERLCSARSMMRRTQQGSRAFKASVGGHYRHCLDFRSVFSGLDAEAGIMQFFATECVSGAPRGANKRRFRGPSRFCIGTFASVRSRSSGWEKDLQFSS